MHLAPKLPDHPRIWRKRTWNEETAHRISYIYIYTYSINTNNLNWGSQRMCFDFMIAIYFFDSLINLENPQKNKWGRASPQKISLKTCSLGPKRRHDASYLARVVQCHSFFNCLWQVKIDSSRTRIKIWGSTQVHQLFLRWLVKHIAYVYKTIAVPWHF